MATLTTLQFKDLTDHIKEMDEVFNDAMMDSVEDMVGLEIFDQRNKKFQNYTIKLNHGLKGVQKITEGSEVAQATGKEGDDITLKTAHYGADVVISKEARLYDQYEQVEENVRSIIDEGMNKIDQSLADIFNHGFSATNYTDVYGDTVTPVGANGKPLFHKAQNNGATSATFSNIIKLGATFNPALSRDALAEARKMWLNYRDPNGINRPIHFDTILVAPSNLDLAERILYSDQIAGSSNNDKNNLKNKFKIITWSKLETDGTNDTSKQWFVFDSKKVGQSLKLNWVQKPKLAQPKEFAPDFNWHWLFDYLYSRGIVWQAYVAGSKGTNAE